MTQIALVSKPGYDALTETDPNNLTFSSDYNTLKYYDSGTINVTVAGTTAEGTVSHGLGYVPFFISMVNGFAFVGGSANLNYNMCPGTFRSTFPPPTVFTYANTYADSSNLYMRVDTGSGSATYTFKYFVFRNKTGL